MLLDGENSVDCIIKKNGNQSPSNCPLINIGKWEINVSMTQRKNSFLQHVSLRSPYLFRSGYE